MLHREPKGKLKMLKEYDDAIVSRQPPNSPRIKRHRRSAQWRVIQILRFIMLNEEGAPDGPSLDAICWQFPNARLADAVAAIEFAQEFVRAMHRHRDSHPPDRPPPLQDRKQVH